MSKTPLGLAIEKVENTGRNLDLDLSEAEAEVIVRAVLMALREAEPTEAMKKAGAFCEPFLTDPGKRPWTPGQITAVTCFEAMLDAALNEEEAVCT